MGGFRFQSGFCPRGLWLIHGSIFLPTLSKDIRPADDPRSSRESPWAAGVSPGKGMRKREVVGQ